MSKTSGTSEARSRGLEPARNGLSRATARTGARKHKSSSRACRTVSRQHEHRRSNVAVGRISIEPSGLSVEDAARALKVSADEVLRLIRGPLRAHRYAGRLWVQPEDLLAYLAERR
jgi:hypothetical protein